MTGQPKEDGAKARLVIVSWKPARTPEAGGMELTFWACLATQVRVYFLLENHFKSLSKLAMEADTKVLKA